MANPAQQQAAQAGLAALVLRELRAIWPGLDVNDMRGPKFQAYITALTRRYGPMSGALSARFFQRARVDAGLPSIRPLVADPPTPETVAKTLDWATRDLNGQSPEIEPTQAKIEAAVAKLVQDVGRVTVLDNVQDDDETIGWARVTETDPCAFCALLATRGAVYRDKGTAGGNANSQFTGSGQFKFHDNCRCHIVPLWNAYEPSAQVRQWEAEYKKTTRGVRGGGTNLLNAWRRHYDANLRPVNAPE